MISATDVPAQSPTNVAILGATGSIGTNTLDVIAQSPDRLRAAGISAHSRLPQAIEQAWKFRPRWVVATDPQAVAAWRATSSELPPETELLTGADEVARMVSQPEIDVVVAAIVGIAGLQGTWAALEAGKRVALANKETLVVAGPLVMALAAERQTQIAPVDSEHSAIWQALRSGRKSEVRRVILTASGGPCRDFSPAQLAEVTIEQALNHPTWAMGKKITIDSATMMNKALEIIEARWLFDLQPDQIQVVIHPQSIVHSLVEFRDGSVMAQLSPPDMKLPIQYALEYPQRHEGVSERMDWSRSHHLDFHPPDPERFPAIPLGLEVASAGGTAGVVVNAANEVAVAEFLAGRTRFNQIVAACRAVLENHNFDPNPTLSDLDRLDRWARQEVLRWTLA
ncbi:MAG: 1-deoxy-D-xylulose-5-phosphate reductoisomerase [Planctomycetales bacterium]|nr:1-deoxy-D-xylulose-5-phosphate reductoisomerase [Planctomycetales bacterium]